jgi:hypothetical protein
MARGGYRKPANPAPVSGPGALSRRTDGAQPVMDMRGGKYGEGKELRELQGSAAMKQSADSARPPAAGANKVTPLFSPTERPEEPVTAGLPFGEGPNIVQGAGRKPTLKETLLKAMQVSDDPDLEVIYNYLESRGDI